MGFVAQSSNYQNFIKNSDLTQNMQGILNKLIVHCYEKILKDFEDFQVNGSGWYFNEVVQLEINTVEFNPTKGSSLPSFLV